MRRTPVICAVVLAGCLPDLSPWRVVDPDTDAGPIRRDAGSVIAEDCSSGARPLGAGYFEGFEAGPGGWGVTGEPSSWELGAPASATINRAAEGSVAWMTGLEAVYFDREDSFVVSPCFDASDAQHDLLLTLSRAYQTEQCCDGATVEYSVDGGTTWEVAAGATRLGWHGSSSGWRGDSEWREASTLLAGTAQQPRVQLRVKFHSDGSATGEGFAFDAVSLRPSAVDLALGVEEAERCGYVNATVTNVGGQTITGYEVSSQVDGVSELETFDSMLAYLETRSVEIGGPLARNLSASVFTVGDTRGDNDSAAFSVTSQVLGSGGWFSDFEADDGGLRVGGQNPSWAWGEPRGALITGAASGARAWVTNLTGEHNRSERSYIQTPCFDTRSLARDPQLSFMQVFRTEECCDTALVEISVDGQSFRRVGSTSSGGTNWYNDFSGWRGSSGAGAWRVAQHPLTDAAGHEFVRFRFAFNADGSTEFEGFAVDDVQVIP